MTNVKKSFDQNVLEKVTNKACSKVLNKALDLLDESKEKNIIRIEDETYTVLLSKFPDNEADSFSSTHNIICINTDNDMFKKCVKEGKNSLTKWLTKIIVLRHVQKKYPELTKHEDYLGKVDEILVKIKA